MRMLGVGLFLLFIQISSSTNTSSSGSVAASASGSVAASASGSVAASASGNAAPTPPAPTPPPPGTQCGFNAETIPCKFPRDCVAEKAGRRYFEPACIGTPNIPGSTPVPSGECAYISTLCTIKADATLKVVRGGPQSCADANALLKNTCRKPDGTMNAACSIPYHLAQPMYYLSKCQNCTVDPNSACKRDAGGNDFTMTPDNPRWKQCNQAMVPLPGHTLQEKVVTKVFEIVEEGKPNGKKGGKYTAEDSVAAVMNVFQMYGQENHGKENVANENKDGWIIDGKKYQLYGPYGKYRMFKPPRTDDVAKMDASGMNNDISYLIQNAPACYLPKPGQMVCILKQTHCLAQCESYLNGKKSDSFGLQRCDPPAGNLCQTIDQTGFDKDLTASSCDMANACQSVMPTSRYKDKNFDGTETIFEGMCKTYDNGLGGKIKIFCSTVTPKDGKIPKNTQCTPFKAKASSATQLSCGSALFVTVSTLLYGFLQ